MSAITGRPAALAHAGAREDSPAGCRFLGEDNRACCAPRRTRSSYCQYHHALCYLPLGSPAEQRRVGVLKRIAAAVGGYGSPEVMTSEFVERLERLQ